MDENNNVTNNDYVIGGPATEPTPVAEPIAETVTAETAAEAVAETATPVAETVAETATPAAEAVAETATPAAEAVAEPIQQPTPDTASTYSIANEAATNPASETPIYTTLDNNTSSPMDSYSVPSSTTYASTDSTTSNVYSGSVNEPAPSNNLAIASLVLGIVGIVLSCCCCGSSLFSIAGIVCGILQKPMEDGKKPGMATAGIITSVVGLVFIIIVTIANVFLTGSLANMEY